MASKTRSKSKLNILVLAIIATALVVAVYLVQQAVSLRSRAAGEAVTLSLTPANASISGSTTLRLVADAKTNRISFLHADISFDRTKVNLSNEVTTVSTLSRVVKKTSRAEANSTGRISIVLAVPPQNLGVAPTGVFEVASLPFNIVTTSTNQTTSVSFVQSAVQVVNTQTTALGSTLANSNLTLNATTGGSTTQPPPPPSTGTSGTANLNPVADASVRSIEPGTNFGTRTTMEINGSPQNIAYLKFDLSSLGGKTVSSAKLRFKASTDSTSTQSIKEVSNSSWSETGLTYNNRPSLGAELTTSNGGTTGQLKEVDITNFVKSRVGGTISLGINQSGGDGYGIYSRESTDKPVLVVTYGTSPAPTTSGSTGSGVEVMFKNIPDPNTINDVFVFNYASAGGTAYQETDSRLTYSGTWRDGTGSKYTVNTASVKFRTDATSATLVTSRGPNRSNKVEVWVNGSLKQVINLANDTVQDNYSVSINLQ